MKYILIPVLLTILALLIGNFYFKALKKDFCFGLDNKSLSYDQFLDEIKKNEKIILTFDKAYFNFEELKKFLYYDIYIYNGLQALIKVSQPKYEKMHKVTLLDRNDENFIVNYGEIKQIEDNARVEDIRKREFVARIPLGVAVAPGGILESEYNPRNGIACITAKPNGIVRFPLVINNLINLLGK